jgi:hypothetical protein
MKLALVLDSPTLSSPRGRFMSDFEQRTTSKLMKQAGFQPDATFALMDKPITNWRTSFLDKGCSLPSPALAAARLALTQKLAGYDVVLTMGVLAMWALTGQTAIDNYRGTHIDSPFVQNLQVVPTYAPHLYCTQAWQEQPIVASAMRKATGKFTDIDRTIYLPESPADIRDWIAQHVGNSIAFDVETNYGGRITEFGITPAGADKCLYVQLEDFKHNAIWSEEDELAIWTEIAMLAARPDVAWGFHNAVYDLSYLVEYGIYPLGHIWDTMLRHHAYQPEWEKSLGFLASLHLPTRAWKHLRKQAKAANNKAGAL